MGCVISYSPTTTLAWRNTLSFSVYPVCTQSRILPFLCFRRCGDYRDGFMEISIQWLVFSSR